MRGWCHAIWRRLCIGGIATMIGLAATAGPATPRCAAQLPEGTAVPRQTYFLALELFNAGRYREALQGIPGRGPGGHSQCRGALDRLDLLFLDDW